MTRSNQGRVQKILGTQGRLVLASVGLWGIVGGMNLSAATIQIDVTLASGTAILSSGGSLVNGGTAYVGSFFNGTSAMSKSAVAALWNATRAGFDSLWSNFVSVASSSVTGGGFNISGNVEVESVGGKSLVGRNVYVLVVDNASSPTGFLLLASDGAGVFDTFADPDDEFEPATNLVLSGEQVTFTVDDVTTIEDPSTTVVGSAGSYNTSSDRWTMTSIPGGSAPPTPTLRLLTVGTPVYTNGNTVVTHTFAGNTNATYVFEYKTSLTGAWQTHAVSVGSGTNFPASFTNVGTNSTSEWKNRMFFRVKNG